MNSILHTFICIPFLFTFRSIKTYTDSIASNPILEETFQTDANNQGKGIPAYLALT